MYSPDATVALPAVVGHAEVRHEDRVAGARIADGRVGLADRAHVGVVGAEGDEPVQKCHN